MLLCSIIVPVAAGLITTFGVDTSLALLIVYPALLGLGYGLGIVGPQTAVQTTLSDTDVPIAIAIILFAQSFGPALMITVTQTLFVSRLLQNLSFIPGLNREAIANNGLTEIVKSVAPSETRRALAAVSRSLSQSWYLAVALGAASILGSLVVEWRSVKTEKEEGADADGAVGCESASQEGLTQNRSPSTAS